MTRAVPTHYLQQVESPADHSRLARALQLVARGLGNVGHERARTNDITSQQAAVVELLESRGMLSTSTLAELLSIDPSTASRNLGGLQRAGLVARKRDGNDGRQNEVRLTPKGRRVAESVAAETVRSFGVLLDRVLRAERQRVTEAMATLCAAVLASEGTA